MVLRKMRTTTSCNTFQEFKVRMFFLFLEVKGLVTTEKFDYLKTNAIFTKLTLDKGCL